MADTDYHFLSYVRSGFAASITQVDTFGSAQAALATAPVGVQVSGVAQAVTHDAVVHGPGDVIGISASQVVRTDPIDGAVGVEPNYFAQIEFDRPDLPWLFTPAAASGERLRPWIVLVVVDAEGEGACTLQPGAPLPVLDVPAPAAISLPNLADSPLWAHAQVIPANGGSVRDALAEGADPRLSVSRLLCPRHLAPNRWYIAAVVPAFNVGRLAGLGQTVGQDDEQKLEPAWQGGQAVKLPVYHSWRFRTGQDVDFESIARRLKGRPLQPGIGTRALDVSRPGAGLPELPVPKDTSDTKGITWLAGALQPVDSGAKPARDATTRQAFEHSLTVLLDRPAELVQSGHSDPIVAPPIYGDKHALVVKLDGASVPPWISELNLHPDLRVTAGLGTQVIQARQEDYVARAWRQLGDVLAANRLLRLAQFARSASLRVHQRLASLDGAALVTMTYPAHARLAGVLPGGKTLRFAVADSRLPPTAVEPALRRIARGKSAVARAAGTPALAVNIVNKFAASAFSAPVDGPDGSTAMRPAGEVIGSAQAQVVLKNVGDPDFHNPGRLDTLLSTLAKHRKTLPTGERIGKLQIRKDVGAVSMLTGLGAVSASAITATLSAATPHPPAPTPVSPPIVHVPPHLGGTKPVLHVPISPQLIAKTHLTLQHTGPSRPITAATKLHAGTMVIDSQAIRDVAIGKVQLVKMPNGQWTNLLETAKVPAIDKKADPINDAGARLDLFRQDPATLHALADVANGNVATTLMLDRKSASLVTTGAAASSLARLATGRYAVALPAIQAKNTGPNDLSAGQEMLASSAAAFDRMARIDDAPPAATAPSFKLAEAKSGLVARLDPKATILARISSRLVLGNLADAPKRDPLDPVMACPQFNDPMWLALNDLGGGWMLPGLEKVPPDTATLVCTNPTFVVAHMVGLNHEMMRELLWREYPTDQRGTPFHRFWGRTGSSADDIGPIHKFAGALGDNLLAGKDGESVLLMRSELLRRYPGSIIYLCRAKKKANKLQLDEKTVHVPVFRGNVPPDISFVGFALTPDELRDTKNPWWFVIAQPPTEPRFGLDDWTNDTPATPSTSNDLAWSHMSADGSPHSPSPFAPGNPPVLHGIVIDGVHWGDSAAVQAKLTYQHPVRIAIRAADLIAPANPGAS